MKETSLLAVLLSMVGGGTLVPLLYTVVSRFKSREVDAAKARAEIEDLSAHAAREAVDATRGVIDMLRQQLQDGHARQVEVEAECSRLRLRNVELEDARPNRGRE